MYSLNPIPGTSSHSAEMGFFFSGFIIRPFGVITQSR